VTFASTYDEQATSPAGLFAGSYVTHPEFGSGGASDPHDIAVVLLRESPGIAPAELPGAGLLDRLKADHELDDQTFTAVGYGTVREDKTGGPHPFFFDGIRRFALQGALNLEKSWLLLSMQPPPGTAAAASATRAARTSSAARRATCSSQSPSPATRCAGPPTRPTGSTPPPPGSSSASSSRSGEPAGERLRLRAENHAELTAVDRTCRLSVLAHRSTRGRD
jgi:hypothetical protein